MRHHRQHTTHHTTTVVGASSDGFYFIAMKYPAHFSFIQKQIRHILKHDKAKAFGMSSDHASHSIVLSQWAINVRIAAVGITA